MYLEYFGLARHPFQITPDANFFFDSQVHKRALATITFGLSKKEGFVVITGEVGAGKTTLIEHLLAGDELANVAVARISTTQLEADNLLELIVDEMGVRKRGTSKAASLADIKQVFLGTADRGGHVLLIVDEVQNLSPGALEELRMLSNFQRRDRALVQMLLVGQPEFKSRLAGRECEQIRQRVIASYHLLPLSGPEVPVYIGHRLRQAGHSGNPIFDEAACRRIHEETGGVPRKINRLCDRLLLYAFLEEDETVDRAAVDVVVAEMRAESLIEEPGGKRAAKAPRSLKRPSAKKPPRRSRARPRNAVNSVPGPPPADYAQLQRTLDDLRNELGVYKTKMGRIMELLSDQESRWRGQL